MTCSKLLVSLAVVAGAVLAADASEAADATVGAPNDAAFDKRAAVHALAIVDLTKCKVPSARHGDGHVTLKFVPAGTVEEATVDHGPFVGTPVGKCVATQFKKAKVPPFKGAPVVVGKSFQFD